eukprot:2784095-Pleurochrysis_carterae.AAC.1
MCLCRSHARDCAHFLCTITADPPVGFSQHSRAGCDAVESCRALSCGRGATTTRPATRGHVEKLESWCRRRSTGPKPWQRAKWRRFRRDSR